MTILVSHSRLWHLERELRTLHLRRRSLLSRDRQEDVSAIDRKIDLLEDERAEILSPEEATYSAKLEEVLKRARKA